MAQQCMLTTFDNPYDPFEQFTQWWMFDIEKGYNSCSRLARIANLESDMTQKEIDKETERAIDEIIAYDFTNTYKKVTKITDDIDYEDTNGQIPVTDTVESNKNVVTNTVDG